MAEWQFFLDENIDPKVATYLAKADVAAKHVRDALGQGADDTEVREYALDHDLVVVTSDVNDFGTLPTEDSGSAGVVLLYDDTMPAYRVASALIAMIDAYPSRDAFAGQEALDAWV